MPCCPPTPPQHSTNPPQAGTGTQLHAQGHGSPPPRAQASPGPGVGEPAQFLITEEGKTTSLVTGYIPVLAPVVA